ncbi:MAG: phage major capsid protein [Pseudomonadota bacterium]
MSKKFELMEQRSALLKKAREAADDTEAFKTIMAEADTLEQRINNLARLEDAERTEPGTPIHGDAKLSNEIRSKFSLVRAIAAQSGLAVDAGFEREVQAELAKRAGRPPKGILIPTEIFEIEKRVLTTSGGSDLIATEHRPDLFISALSANTVVRSLGATVLTGLIGNLSIPRETDSPAVGWVAENAALTPDDAAFDDVTLSPHHVGTIAEYSRDMLLQSSPAVEQLLRNMMARNIAKAIDVAAIQGGGANEPSGILDNNDIQTVDGSALDIFTAVADAVSKADIANVTASRALLTDNVIKKIASLALDGQGRPIGIANVFSNERVVFSNLVPTDANSPANRSLIYGDWTELLLGIWSELDVLVNPYESTAYSKGNISVRAMATVDVALRHPEAFVSIQGITASSDAMPASP